MLAAFVLAVAVGIWFRSTRSAEREAGRNVLLITVDTLRADALGAYGKKDALTPWIDRLAAAGVVFTDAHAHNVTTLASHANILSGRLPTSHGVRDNAGFRFPAATETLATLLKARGYRTAAFVSAFPLAARFGLARGFDVYDDRFVDAQVAAAAARAGAPRRRDGGARESLDRGVRGLALVLLGARLRASRALRAARALRRALSAADPYHGEVAAADAVLGPAPRADPRRRPRRAGRSSS